MIDWLILLALIGEVLILSKLDRTIYGTWITPFSLLAFPYSIVVIIAFFFVPAFGFISLYVDSVLIWVVGLLFFWLGGQAIALPFGKTVRSRIKKNQPVLYEKKSEKLVFMLAWITIFVMSCGLLISLQSLGWQQIATDEFAKSYGYGWFGHFRCFSMGLTVFLIGTARRKNIFGLFTILILIVLYMMYPVKSWTIIPVLGGVIYRVSSGRYKPSILKISSLLFLVFSIFIAAYLIDFGVKNVENVFSIATYEQLLRHIVAYIFAGVLALGEVVQSGITNHAGDPHIIFAPFVNLYTVVFSGDMISNVTKDFSIISLNGIKASNVHTFFGTIFINLGHFLGVVYVVLLGGFVYFCFALPKITRNCWFEVIWSFIGAMLSVGWFEFYFWHLAAVEVPIYCAFFGFLFWLSVQRYQRSRYPRKLLTLNPIV